MNYNRSEGSIFKMQGRRKNPTPDSVSILTIVSPYLGSKAENLAHTVLSTLVNFSYFADAHKRGCGHILFAWAYEAYS